MEQRQHVQTVLEVALARGLVSRDEMIQALSEQNRKLNTENFTLREKIEEMENELARKSLTDSSSAE